MELRLANDQEGRHAQMKNVRVVFELIVDASPAMGFNSVDDVVEMVEEIVRDSSLAGFDMRAKVLMNSDEGEIVE